MSVQYAVKRMEDGVGALSLSGEFFPERLSGAYAALEEARIDRYCWGGAYRPEAFARVGWNAQGLNVLMAAREETIAARETRTGGAVCRDSCLEFFVRPFLDDARYLNVEVNAAGVAHIGLGAGRADRLVLDRVPEGMDIAVSAHAGAWWAVSYRLPSALIRALFGRELEPGALMRGNFYTCDETIHPHFGAWSPVDTPAPDFHQSGYFGYLSLESAR